MVINLLSLLFLKKIIMTNTKVDSSKPPCEIEKYIKQYYGLPYTISERYKIVTDFGILVDLLYGFRDKINENQKGNLKTIV